MDCVSHLGPPSAPVALEVFALSRRVEDAWGAYPGVEADAERAGQRLLAQLALRVREEEAAAKLRKEEEGKGEVHRGSAAVQSPEVQVELHPL